MFGFFRSPQERRVYTRAPLREHIEVTHGSARFACKAMDISRGGMAVRSHVRLRPGQTIHLRFGLGSGREYETDAVVANETAVDGGFKLGVEFRALPRDTRRAIARYVDRSRRRRNPSLVVVSSGPGLASSAA